MFVMLYAIVCLLLFTFGFFDAPENVRDPSVGEILRANSAFLLYTAIAVALGFSAWFGVSVMQQKAFIDSAGGGYPIKRADNPELWNLLENMCISRGIPMPKFSIMETSAVNAFASGFTKDTYGITVTRGLLQRLNKEEVEGVLGHELTHIRNGDVRLMMIALLVVGGFAFISEVLMRNSLFGVAHGSERDSNHSNLFIVLFTIGLVAVAWVISLFIKAALSRQREYLADAGAVELTENPNAMISALQKIAGKSDIKGATSGFMEMCCDNSPKLGFFGFLDTHPPIQKRIQALIRYAGGSDTPSSGTGGSTPLDSLGPWDKVTVQEGEAPSDKQNPRNPPRLFPFPPGPF
jgi:heat shock protein HtpX